MRPFHLLPALLAMLGASAFAQDLSLSGFGTLGYARSNRDYTYQRSIDDRGTFRRDSVLGVQADLQLTPQWSATLQLKAAQSLKRDDRWDLVPAWAFVAWRPADDWLLRVGRMRVPLYLHSESLDVGVTYDMARLPAEMYSIVPSTDFKGGYATRTWSLGSGELALDVYAGRNPTTVRNWSRDGVPPAVAAGAQFADIDVGIAGAVLTLRQPDTLWRAGVVRTRSRRADGGSLPVSYPFVPIAPGLGYYKVAPEQPGPDLPTTAAIRNTVYTLGVQHDFGSGWRVEAEFARNVQHDTDIGSDTRGGYVALFRRIGPATPYVSLGALRSSAGMLDWYRRLTETQLPAGVPGAEPSNAAQRLAAESFYAVDQRTLAIGTSYAIDSMQKLKVEWQRTRIGSVSRLVDTPPGQASLQGTHVDVWSLSYNLAF